IDVRELGFSRLVEVPNTSLLCATGNNLETAKDSVRRTLFCRLDAGVEQPELRSFERDVVETAYAERTQLVAAGLTILRAWHAAKTAIGVSPLGSFEQWSFRVRQPLLWLDQTESSRAWLARVKTEVDLWSDLAKKLSATQSVPDVVGAYQQCVA